MARESAAITTRKLLLFDATDSLQTALQLPPILQRRESKAKPSSTAKKSSASKLPTIQQNRSNSLTAVSPAPVVQQRLQDKRPRVSIGRDKLDNYNSQGTTVSDARKNFEVQTDPFLEPLPISLEMSGVMTQTDEFLPRPPSPMFVPKSSGVDAETQIGEGDLFDFDVEIEPVLSSIVGQCIEQAWLEATQELELDRLKMRMQQYESRKRKEQTEILRLEEEEKRRQDEKQRRIAEQLEKRARFEEMEKARICREMAKVAVKQSIAGAFRALESQGYFTQQEDKAISDAVWDGYLMAGVSKELSMLEEARGVLDVILMEVIRS